jgi:hypothetical protein
MAAFVKFTHITRTIDPQSQIHYLDAIDEQGRHWSAQMSPHMENWLVYTEFWARDPQQPYL